MKHHFEKFCKDYENIENYEKVLADNFVGWDCHHRLETHTSDGERRLVDITHKELIALGMYYNRPPEELIFLTRAEHDTFRKGKFIGEKNPMYGKKHTEESKKKNAEAHKGEKHHNYGKHLSEETRNKIGEGNKGKKHTKEHINKIAEANRGKHWYNNGKINKYCFECPEGFVPGKLKRK